MSENYGAHNIEENHQESNPFTQDSLKKQSKDQIFNEDNVKQLKNPFLTDTKLVKDASMTSMNKESKMKSRIPRLRSSKDFDQENTTQKFNPDLDHSQKGYFQSKYIADKSLASQNSLTNKNALIIEDHSSCNDIISQKESYDSVPWLK